VERLRERPAKGLEGGGTRAPTAEAPVSPDPATAAAGGNPTPIPYPGKGGAQRADLSSQKIEPDGGVRVPVILSALSITMVGCHPARSHGGINTGRQGASADRPNR